MDNNNEFNTNETLHETGSSVVKPDADFEFLAYLSKDKADRLLDFLKFSGIDNVNSEYDRLNDSYNVEVMSKDFEKASNLYHIADHEFIISCLKEYLNCPDAPAFPYTLPE